MISYDDALKIMLTSARPLGTERVPLQKSMNRILADNIVSDVDMPPFNKSAMDGYACRRADLGNVLMVVEEIPAGSFPARKISLNECAKIMTGAPVPEGADVVIMREDTDETSAKKIRFKGKNTSKNICLKGEDVAAGTMVLKKGELITPAHMAILASVGCVEPLVSTRPRVGLIATGDELVEPDRKPGRAGIRNSNSCQLLAQISEIGGLAKYYGIAADKREALMPVIQKARGENDVVVISGGVSAGDYDFVPEMLKTCGFEIMFESVAMQPGKPTVFGRNGNVLCIGLPGNPVSTFVVFELLVKPLLYRMMNHEHRPMIVSAVLDADVSRKNTARQSTIPVVFTSPGTVLPMDYHGSAHIHAMCRADGLVTIPANTPGFKKGSSVHVRSL